jgi:hypothetical protein
MGSEDAAKFLPTQLELQATGRMPAPRGPGILPGASSQPKLLCFPHFSAAWVLVLDTETIVLVIEPLAIDTVRTSRSDEPYEKRNP